MVSSTLGSPTLTGWKRRSSAASFSMMRYSSSVVAPIMRSSPRASIGLRMLPASAAPSALPAPTMVCSSSTNVMIWPSEAWISLRTAFSRSSNSPRYFAPATIAVRSSWTSFLSASSVGHVALDDAAGQPLGDGGLADAGLADQHRVVLGAADQHLDDPADLLVPADDRVELALAGERGQVAPVLLQRLVGRLGVLRGDALRPADLLERPEDRRPGDAGVGQHLGDAVGGLGHRHQQVLGGHVVVVEPARPPRRPRRAPSTGPATAAPRRRPRRRPTGRSGPRRWRCAGWSG